MVQRLIPDPNKFLFIREPSDFDSIQSWPATVPKHRKGYKEQYTNQSHGSIE